MKVIVILAVLLSCALAVDWTTFTCAQVGSLRHSDYSCSDWITLPTTNTQNYGTAYCVSSGNACRINSDCSPSQALRAILYPICGMINTNFGTTTGSTTGRP